MGSGAVEFLQESGLELTPEGLRRAAHLFGWLWHWSDEEQDRWKSVRVANMDGDEMLWHTASFSVADVEQTRQRLLARSDIEQEQADEFVWIQRSGPAVRKMGGPVNLGRIELVDAELILSVNSSRRFAKARKWIEKLPGVEFGNVATRDWNEAEADRPADERMATPDPVEMTPELAGAIQEMLNKQLMGWLDTSLPILGGQTPRQACKTPAGRQQVAMLIRTMPDPMGPVAVHVPRQAMLENLGLVDQPAAPTPRAMPSPTMPSMPSPSAGRTGRNDPCPCGSGKKYKKCCGR
jgi:hypothetical protein